MSNVALLHAQALHLSLSNSQETPEATSDIAPALEEAPAPALDEAWSVARSRAVVEALITDCVGAISMVEIGPAAKVRESSMRTVSGVAASYASAGQHVASKTISTLKKLTQAQLETMQLSQAEVRRANRVCYAAGKVWSAATGSGAPREVAALRSKVEDKHLRLSRFTEANLERMLLGGQMFNALRKAINAAGGRTKLKVKSAASARRRCAEDFFEASPLPRQLGIRVSDLDIYIRSGFGEDKAGWQRVALGNAAPGEANDELGARIQGAAEGEGGWQLPRIDIGNAVEAALEESALASDLDILQAAITIHSQGGRQAYRDRAEGYFRDLRARREAGDPWSFPGAC